MVPKIGQRLSALFLLFLFRTVFTATSLTSHFAQARMPIEGLYTTENQATASNDTLRL